MRKLLPVVLLVLFASCSKDDHPNRLNKTDKNFLLQTYLASREEIESGQLALSRSHDPAVFGFAQQVIDQYSLTRDDVKAVALEVGFDLADTATFQNQGIYHLTNLNGYDFDTAYIRSRELSQKQLLDQFQVEFNEGNHTYVRYYLINRHIDMVKKYYLRADSIGRAL